MKKIITILVLIVSVVIQGNAQDKLKIGDVVNGRLKITNDTGLRKFFLGSLENSGCLGKDIKTEISPTADRFVAYTRVTGNAKQITSIGVLLVTQGNEAFILEGGPGDASGPGGGGSATYSCVGSPCSDCKLNITWPSGSWMPDVNCLCEEAPGHCNMIVSVSVNINLGY